MWCSARIPPYAPRKEKTDPHLVHLSASPRRHPYGSPEGRFAWDEASKVVQRRLTQLLAAHAIAQMSGGIVTTVVLGEHPAPPPKHGFPPVKASNGPYPRCPQLDAARRESLSERHADRRESDEREELPHDMAPEVCITTLHRIMTQVCVKQLQSQRSRCGYVTLRVMTSADHCIPPDAANLRLRHRAERPAMCLECIDTGLRGSSATIHGAGHR